MRPNGVSGSYRNQKGFGAMTSHDMHQNIGWRFPLSNGGGTEGWNDPGMGYFKEHRYYSLAREIIQNSMDAAIDEDIPVSVVFKTRDVGIDEIGGAELLSAVEACLQIADNVDATFELGDAKRILSESTISSLVISDKNTTGLKGKKWKTLVKDVGTSQKDRADSGGSHGIGKHAPFVMSNLRTVFYWSAWEEDGVMTEKLQGKSILMSHGEGDAETRSRGYYGIKDRCEAVGQPMIPEVFRIKESNGDPACGTNVVILGFKQTKNWRHKIAISVLTNFHFAIDRGQLEVTIEQREDKGYYMNDITKDTINGWFDYLLKLPSGEIDEQEIKNLKLAKTFRDTYRHQDTEYIVMSIPHLGEVEMWVLLGDNLPRKVGIIRKSGMLITSEQQRLKSFTQHKPFSAIVFISDLEGNELLKRMENPKHDQFSAEFLPDYEQGKGKEALKKLVDIVREKLREIVDRTEKPESEDMSLLVKLLPDPGDEEEFDIEEDIENWREVAFSRRMVPQPRPEPRPPSPYNPPNRPRRINKKVSNLRILPANDEKNLYRVAFTPMGSGDVVLELKEMGDSDDFEISGVEWMLEDMAPVKSLVVNQGERVEIYARTTTNLWGMSCLLTLHGLSSEESGSP